MAPLSRQMITQLLDSHCSAERQRYSRTNSLSGRRPCVWGTSAEVECTQPLCEHTQVHFEMSFTRCTHIVLAKNPGQLAIVTPLDRAEHVNVRRTVGTFWLVPLAAAWGRAGAVG